jgi:hypothetical protein
MMLTPHTAADYGDALRALLPPGAAWEWPAGGLGDTMLIGTGQELARVDAPVAEVLALALARHTIKLSSWRLVDYQAVAAESQVGIAETVPRAAFVVGSAAGQRLWSNAGASFAVPLLQVDMCRPFGAGSAAGTRLWGERARYVLLVTYYASLADLAALREALTAYKQAHMLLFFVDVTGSGGEVVDA